VSVVSTALGFYLQFAAVSPPRNRPTPNWPSPRGIAPRVPSPAPIHRTLNTSSARRSLPGYTNWSPPSTSGYWPPFTIRLKRSAIYCYFLTHSAFLVAGQLIGVLASYVRPAAMAAITEQESDASVSVLDT